MNENQLAENLKHYRKKKGLSQEKVAEYMNVSRQAVTKWEANSSRPSSDNLIKLAALLEVNVDTLLGNEEEKLQTESSVGKMSWFFIGISALCVIIYIISSVLTDTFSSETLICMFISFVPIQLFLHIYFFNAIKNNSFSGIAGFDDKIDYDIAEVKKLLIQIDLHIGVISTVYIFLLCALSQIDLKIKWFGGVLFMIYFINFVAGIEMNNYKMIDKIYRDEDDKKRAKRSIPITVIYTAILCIGVGIAGIVFEVKGIENNTLPAIKICGLLLLGIISVTTGFLLENGRIKKWNPTSTDYRISKSSVVSVCICLVMYGLMCVV
ncbi:MAG: helix-turn-helix domain-containing protein [Clostridiales bacterium]|nr:helix-turn-helix domain-containing protein [Clostridiales bacterium]